MDQCTIFLMEVVDIQVVIASRCMIHPVPVGHSPQQWPGVSGKRVEVQTIDDDSEQLSILQSASTFESSSHYRKCLDPFKEEIQR